MTQLRIATRRSALALWQTNHVADLLRAHHPGLEVSLVPIVTTGDRIQDRPLSEVGGKGLFIKELEVAMAEGRAELAVHSMKDVPAVLPDGFVIGCVLPRADPRDAFLSRRYPNLASLPQGARVGTSSQRRQSILRARRPDLAIVPLRGNVDTRLRKLDDGDFDAIILAAAGLTRLGLGARIRAVLPAELSLPSPGQGALGIEALASRPDVARWLAPLNDATTAACVRAERACARALGGSCEVPLGSYAQPRDGQVWLRGFVATPDGSRIARAELQAAADDPEALGLALAAALRERGADAILAALAG